MDWATEADSVVSEFETQLKRSMAGWQKTYQEGAGVTEASLVLEVVWWPILRGAGYLFESHAHQESDKHVAVHCIECFDHVINTLKALILHEDCLSKEALNTMLMAYAEFLHKSRALLLSVDNDTAEGMHLRR